MPGEANHRSAWPITVVGVITTSETDFFQLNVFVWREAWQGLEIR